MAHHYERTSEMKANREDDRPAKMFANLVREAIRKNRMSDFIPSLHISASLHAVVRWDKRRKYLDMSRLREQQREKKCENN